MAKPKADAVDEGDPRRKIERLERRIEELADSIERCRKIALASKIAAAAGGALLVAIAFGAVRFDGTALIAAIAAVLGGIVVMGSNSRTAAEMAAQLRAAEAERAALIGVIDLRVVQ